MSLTNWLIKYSTKTAPLMQDFLIGCSADSTLSSMPLMQFVCQLRRRSLTISHLQHKKLHWLRIWGRSTWHFAAPTVSLHHTVPLTFKSYPGWNHGIDFAHSWTFCLKSQGFHCCCIASLDLSADISNASFLKTTEGRAPSACHFAINWLLDQAQEYVILCDLVGCWITLMFYRLIDRTHQADCFYYNQCVPFRFNICSCSVFFAVSIIILVCNIVVLRAIVILYC